MVRQQVKKTKFTPERTPLVVGRLSRGIFLIWREKGESLERLVVSTSSTGKSFPKKFAPVIIKNKTKVIDTSRCEDFKVTSVGKNIYLTFIDKASGIPKLILAKGTNPKAWSVVSEMKVGAPGVYLPALTKKSVSALYFGKDALKVSTSRDGKRWHIPDGQPSPHWRFFDGLPFSIIGLHTNDEGIFVFCGASLTEEILNDVNRGQKIGETRICRLSVALFTKSHPGELLWQTQLPFMDLPIGEADSLTFLGLIPIGTTKKRILRVYFSARGQVNFFEFPEEALFRRHAYAPIHLTKSVANPILSPRGNDWEAQSVFNPTALKINDRVHMLYRAIGNDGISRLGYASSLDGIHMEDRLTIPALALSDPRSRDVEHRHYDLVMYPSGGSWGGSEDPRMVLIEDKVYVTFNMFDGWNNLRVAVVWLNLDDFLAKRFWKWSTPILLSPPRQVHKNWILFPEKINGKFALIHNLHGASHHEVKIEYVSDLKDFTTKKDFKSADPNAIADRPVSWHKRMRSGGPPPIKTPKGWLLFYHATDRYEPSRYKLGVMLLDLKDPTKVLHRANASVLNPDTYYENNGKPGIVYACGAVEMGDSIYVYYGGADRVTCVATVKTSDLLHHIIKDEVARFKINKVKVS